MIKDTLKIKDKVICIMGGTGLIGSVLTKGFAECGGRVFVGTRTPEKYLNKTDGVTYLKIDVRSSDSIRKFISSVTDKHRSIDVWINSAWPKTDNVTGSIEEENENIVAKDITDHLMAFYLCCREIFMHMKKNKKGSIINYGSIYGELSPDFKIYKETEIQPPSPSYPMIKGGIHAYTKYLASYAAPYNIRVNAICPGGVLDKHTEKFQKKYGDRIPLGRMANQEEMLSPALFLASETSSYITGHLLNVDGGLHAW
mgnify:CR=1 FL=1